jgi:hypothetical protein
MTIPEHGRVGRDIGWLLLKLYVLCLLICALGRAALLIWQHARLQDLSLSQQLMAFVHGLRMDTMAASFLLLPVVAVLCLWPRQMLAPAMARLVRGWMLMGVLLFVFMEAASFPFFC